MIHINVLRKILQKNNIPFNCKVWKSDGEILIYNNVVCTSTNFHRNTANLKFLESGEIRKTRIVSIFEFNDEEIIL